ncbi:pentapeptide repeat-containing protein [bacterium]|nr:pentapeptide repeat-containing protein [bacterium]
MDSGGLGAIQTAVTEGAYLGEAQLAECDLTTAALRGALMPQADFRFAILVHADFEHATLAFAQMERANLLMARLVDAGMVGARLDEANLSSADATGADLRCAAFGGKADLQSAVLVGAALGGAGFSSEADLDGVTWSRLYVVPDEDELPARPPRDPVDSAQWSGTLRACERTYRQIKQNYEHHGQYDLAGQFFIREMECKRKQSTGLRRVAFWLMRVLCDYFESPGKVVGIAVGIILLCAWFHGWAGIVDSGGNAVLGPGLEWPSWAAISQFVSRALYYSTVTFTTLGYGDYHAANGWGRVLSAAEAATGAILLALFLVCLARKYGRA